MVGRDAELGPGPPTLGDIDAIRGTDDLQTASGVTQPLVDCQSHDSLTPCHHDLGSALSPRPPVFDSPRVEPPQKQWADSRSPDLRKEPGQRHQFGLPPVSQWSRASAGAEIRDRLGEVMRIEDSGVRASAGIAMSGKWTDDGFDHIPKELRTAFAEWTRESAQRALEQMPTSRRCI